MGVARQDGFGDGWSLNSIGAPKGPLQISLGPPVGPLSFQGGGRESVVGVWFGPVGGNAPLWA
jgi:hypothetical protein